MENILIIGSGGQLGSELEDYLVSLYGREKIYSSDIKKNNSNGENFILLDALNKDNIYETIKENNIKIVYHLAAILSANTLCAIRVGSLYLDRNDFEIISFSIGYFSSIKFCRQSFKNSTALSIFCSFINISIIPP